MIKKGPEEVYISASLCDKGEHTCPKAVTTTSTRLCNAALLAAKGQLISKPNFKVFI